MNYFCSECSAKPGWHFDHTKAFQHSCQRCFRNRPCNDYTQPSKPKESPAPAPKDLVREAINSQSEVNLPRAKGHVPPPQPVYPVDPPGFKPDHSGPVHIEEVPLVPPPVIPAPPDTRNEADKALDAIQPNRPGIKMKTVDKNGRELPTAKPQPAKVKPEFEVAEDVKAK